MNKYIIDTNNAAQELFDWIREEGLTPQFDGYSMIVNGEEFIYKGEALATLDKFRPKPQKITTKDDLADIEIVSEDYTNEEIIERTEKALENKENLPHIKLQEDPYENDLIFGKNKTVGITAIEIVDNDIWIFLNNGKIQKMTNKYWLVSPRSSKTSERLDGNLHYKHLLTFDDYDSFNEARGTLYKYKADFYHIFDEQEAAMVYNGLTCFKGLRVEDVSVLSFDIEADGLIDNETNIPIVGNKAEVYMISNTFRDSNKKIERKLFSSDEYEDQFQMIEAWCNWIQEKDPSIICGHNIFGYDLPYLSYCYKMKCSGDLNLGKNCSDIKYNNRISKFRKDGSQSYDYTNVQIFGRQVIDTMFLAIKHDFKRLYPNYTLKGIIEFEKLIKKDRQFYDSSLISKNWKIIEEREKIKKYCSDDSDDSLALYDLMIPQFFYYAQSIPKPFQKINNSATGSQINSFLVRSYLQIEHSLPKSTEAESFQGAISFGVPGIWEHVNKVDIKSQYPSIMIMNEIYDRDKDPNGHFLEMVKYFTYERFANKKLNKETGDRYYYDLEQGQKIVINSAYGLLGASGLLFNSPKLAADVTRVGRELTEAGITWASGCKTKQIPILKKDGTPERNDKGEIKLCWVLDEQESKGRGFQIVNADTDSFSYTTGKKLTKDEFDAHITEINNLFDKGIIWEDDGCYKSVLVVKAKNYALKSYNKKEPIVIKGSALKATMKEKALCFFISEVIDLLLSGKKDQLFQLYNHYAQEIVFPEIDISRWSSKKTITKAILNPERTNEERVLNAIKHRNFREGDKFRTYFTNNPDFPVRLEDEYKNDHDSIILLEKLYKTLNVFATVIDIDCFPNYKLKRNQGLLGL